LHTWKCRWKFTVEFGVHCQVEVFRGSNYFYLTVTNLMTII
jgi:hypothetical protein